MSKTNLKFLAPTSIPSAITATVGESGRLVFSYAAAKKMKLMDRYHENNAIVFAVNEDNQSDLNLYAIVSAFTAGIDAFRIDQFVDENDHDNNDYYYVDAQPLFDTLGLNYTSRPITFRIEEVEMDGKKMYHFLEE